MKRDPTDPTAGEPLGALTWYFVTLDAPLTTTGYVAATILAPVAVTDAEIANPLHEFDDEWRATERKLPRVWNGFEPGNTIAINTRCRVDWYFSKWIVTEVDC